MRLRDIFLAEVLYKPSYSVSDWACTFVRGRGLVEVEGAEVTLPIDMAVPNDSESIEGVIALLVNAACRFNIKRFGAELSLPDAWKAANRLRLLAEDKQGMDVGFGAFLVHDPPTAILLHSVSDRVIVHPVIPPGTVTVVGEADYLGRIATPGPGDPQGYVGMMLHNHLAVQRAIIPI